MAEPEVRLLDLDLLAMGAAAQRVEAAERDEQLLAAALELAFGERRGLPGGGERLLLVGDGGGRPRDEVGELRALGGELGEPPLAVGDLAITPLGLFGAGPGASDAGIGIASWLE
ncbi:MAG TPA: hypothetical protein PKO05_05620, partial [Thermoanaerobaculia bacterium]|nr:hypothetical protein [Thermoanaerobaculia bacterium]